MKKLFDLNNPVYQNITKLVNYIYLSLLILLFSSVLFSMGTAFSAGYYTYNKIFYTDEDRVFHVFWHSFIENLKGTAVVFSVFVCSFVLLYVNYQASQNGLILLTGFKFVFLGIGILMATYLLYYLCLAARFANTVGERLLSALSICVLNLPVTLILIAVLITFYFLVTIIPITILLAPGLLVAVSHRFCEEIFRFYVSEI